MIKVDNQSEAIKNVYLHEDGKAVTIIDQTKLPTVTEYLTLERRRICMMPFLN